MTELYNILKLKERRAELRSKQTPQEGILWARIRSRKFKYKFRRQHSIGGYIADFYCPAKRLVIEIDGFQHFEKENLEYDELRTQFFNSADIKVLRFTNGEINTNINGVLLKIISELQSLPLTKGELPEGEGV